MMMQSGQLSSLALANSEHCDSHPHFASSKVTLLNVGVASFPHAPKVAVTLSTSWQTDMRQTLLPEVQPGCSPELLLHGNI